MKIKEQLEDIKLAIKNDRRIWAIGGGLGVVILLFLFFSGSETRKRPSVQAPQVVNNPALSGTSQALGDILVTLGNTQKNSDRRVGELADKVDKMQHMQEANSQQIAGVIEGVVDQLDSLKAEITKKQETNLPEINVDDSSRQNVPQRDNSLVSWGNREATVPPPPPPPLRPTRMTFIAAGDSAKVKLLTGVNAPVDGTPYPVVFKLIDAISGPDGSSLDLGEARLIAAAIGSETDGRVIFRLTNLSIRHADGRRSVIPVDGWVVGEDGVRGMRGKLIDKLGRLIAATAGTSFFAALGERLSDKSNGINLDLSGSDNVRIDNGDLNVATTSAFTDASRRLTEILLNRYEKLIPVVEVLSDRQGAAIFSDSAEVALMDEDLGDESAYSSLD